MDPDGNRSIWTARRKRKDAFAAGTQSGGSDLSSSESDIDMEPARNRQRMAGSSSSDNADGEEEGVDEGENSHNGDAEEDSIEEEMLQEVEEELEHISEEDDSEDGGINEDDHGDQEEDQNADDNQLGQEEVPGGAQLAVDDFEENNEHSDSSSNSSESSNDSEDDSDSGVSSESDGSDGSDQEEVDGVDFIQAEADGDVPLYENARITKMESIMMILTLALTFNLSGQCLVRIMELIELHCPAVNRCVKTLYNFKKIFKDIGRHILVLHYYCERCYGELESKDGVCNQCQNETKSSFLIEVPIINQLQRMYLRPGFEAKLSFRFTRQKKHANNIEDIYDSRLYQEHMGQNGLLNDRKNISFMWYTDGISIFNSSKFSVWPIFLVINELNYKERTKKENILLIGLWFGKSKPKPNLFLRHFRRFFETFRTTGYQFNVPEGPAITVKGLLLCGTADLQAKGIFLRSKQSNGFYGCSKCLSAGERVPAGRTTVHVHRYISPDQMQLRNNGEVPELARQKMYGYKGLSLLHVMMPCMTRGTAIDALHMLFLGISKLVTKFWFEPQFSGEPFSCSRMTDVINEVLSSIKPPSFVQRLTRTIADIKQRKGREYKIWFFYYSFIVLKDILEDVYLQHHLKLVSAVALLTQDSIFPEQIDAADALLHEYVRDFQALYGIRFMGMNIHLLLHLAEQVRDLGNLWIYSCFFLEDLNGQLVKLIHGPNQPGLQICSSASLFLSLNHKIDTLPPESIAKEYCLALRKVGSCNYRIAENISEKITILGKSAFDLNVSPQTLQLLRNHLELPQNIGHFQVFFSIRKSGVVFDCERKMRSSKRCSMYACFMKNGRPVLGKIKEFIRFSECNCPTICFCRPAQYFSVVQEFERIVWHAHDVENVRIAYVSAVKPTDNFYVFTCDEINALCFYMKVADVEYIATPINSLEYE